MKLSNETLQLFKAALDAYEQETGVQIQYIDLNTHFGDHETAAKLENLGFTYNQNEEETCHWVKGRTKIDDIALQANYFYTPDIEDEEENPTYYCDECQGYFDDEADMAGSDLCEECADKIAQEDEADLKHQNAEYWSTRL